MFNPATPGTFTFADFTSGTQQKEVEFASTRTYLSVRNNYNVPVKVWIYLCVPRVDTSTAPDDVMEAGLVDEGS